MCNNKHCVGVRLGEGDSVRGVQFYSCESVRTHEPLLHRIVFIGFSIFEDKIILLFDWITK